MSNRDSRKQINVEVGQQIKKYREAAGLSREVFSEKIGISPPVLLQPGKWLCGNLTHHFTNCLRILWRVGGRHIVDRPSIRQRGGRADRNHAGRGIARYASADCRQHPRTSQADRAGPSGRDSAAGPRAGRRMTSSRLLFFRFPAVLHISLFLPQS